MSLSISDFQKIANGTSNAGSITLTSRGKLDKVGFSYRISITGLGTGAPRIASVGFTQDVNARDMQ